jgi:hypothetical protein
VENAARQPRSSYGYELKLVALAVHPDRWVADASP